ncbi:MAG TPA: DUF3108 domain-containing protein [Bryobacteraceae bacterium]|nr:DUF3108 domain-containing protein [Bryobacteraceae bacterium]
MKRIFHATALLSLAALVSAQPPIDPKTTAAASGPKPVAELQPGVYKFQAKLALGGQQLTLSVSTTIKEENGAWSAIDVIDTPSGPAVDTATLDRGTLALRKRTVQQGPLNISITIENGKAIGSMNLGGKETPIAVDLGGPVFGDGPGGAQSIASLPLAEGYTTTFRQLDVQKQKVKTMRLRVAGTEMVTVPAGTFDTFRVELASQDGPGQMTVWVARGTHKPVKLSTVLTQAGDATMTEELLP